MTLFTYPVSNRRAVSAFDAFDRLFADPFFYGAARRRAGVVRRAHPVRVDLYEHDDALVVRFELPGVKKENVTLNLEKDVLTVDVHDEAKDEETARQPRARRAIRVPVDVKAGEIGAELRDGVLSVTLPKADAAKARPIPLN